MSSKDTSSRSYDALLYGISIGVDPDVFVYWHTSQNDPRSNRLNFSEYSSKAADEGLESGRTRTDAGLRTIKYRPFLQAWQRDLPALGLYLMVRRPASVRVRPDSRPSSAAFELYSEKLSRLERGSFWEVCQ